MAGCEIYAEVVTGEYTFTTETRQIEGERLQPAAEKHEVKVRNGSADKSSAAPGEIVTITADKVDGQIFVAWQDKRGDTPLDDYFSSTTTFTMGDNDVAYSASLRDLKVPYTDESKAEPGQTLTVDESYFEELADESIKMLEAYENGLGYQWYENGKAIKGATKKSLKIEDSIIGAI